MRKPKSYDRVGNVSLFYIMEKIYTKPQVEAKNAPSGSYAAGCPTHHSTTGPAGMKGRQDCKACEMSA